MDQSLITRRNTAAEGGTPPPSGPRQSLVDAAAGSSSCIAILGTMYLTTTFLASSLALGASAASANSNVGTNPISRIPLKQPKHARELPKDLIGISIESAVVNEWAGTTAPNQFVNQALNNLKELTGVATPVRIGGQFRLVSV